MSTRTRSMAGPKRPRAGRRAAALKEYRRRRRFGVTSEPRGASQRRAKHVFVIQKHAATRLHYDFRLEWDGVLKSWAVPKGPSLDPNVKRLAVQVEDHPIEYASFEGVIPEGEYGAGRVIVWDRGRWESEKDVAESFQRGVLHFHLKGKKLHGAWTLIRLAKRPSSRSHQTEWLLRKDDDEYARPGSDTAILEEQPASVKSGRTIEELANGEAPTKRQRMRHGGAASPKALAASKPGAPGGVTAEDGFLAPQLPTLVDFPPAGQGWIHEPKLDGYRILARVRSGKATLYSRAGNDWTNYFPHIVHALERNKGLDAYLDGEVVVLTKRGVADFQALQNALHGGPGRIVYFLFDLLEANRRDLRSRPLEERRQRLRELLSLKKTDPIRWTEPLSKDGPASFRRACKTGLEGIVSKLAEGKYRAGRSADWRKSKCLQTDEFFVGGWQASVRPGREISSLLLGRKDDAGRLVYAGHVGTGFNMQDLGELSQILKVLEQPRTSFEGLPKPPVKRDTHWAAPRLVVQVRYLNWTADRILRGASFQGVRLDKTEEELAKPMRTTTSRTAASRPAKSRPTSKPTDGQKDLDLALRKVRFTNPDKILFPEMGLSKLDLAAYYVHVASWMLPHLTGRPLSLVRCPEGRLKTCFFQKHIKEGSPKTLDTTLVHEGSKGVPYAVVNDLTGLLTLVQMGVLEIHPWGSRADALERPDRLIFDLDPHPSLTWSQIADAAVDLRRDLEALGLVSFLKTTGGKGLHVVVPIERRLEWPEAKAFARAVVHRMAERAPTKFTIKAAKSARGGRVFLDYLRNGRGATAIAPYSTRSRPNAPVALPIGWEELANDVREDHFNVSNVPQRLRSSKQNPWADFLDVRQRIRAKAFRRATA